MQQLSTIISRVWMPGKSRGRRAEALEEQAVGQLEDVRLVDAVDRLAAAAARASSKAKRKKRRQAASVTTLMLCTTPGTISCSMAA